MTAKNTAKRKTALGEFPATARKSRTERPAARPEEKTKKIRKTGGTTESKKKVVRGSFKMPRNDYAKIAELKQICLKAGVQVKKSELLRAGLHALGKLSAAQLKQAIAQMEQSKTGRPKKS